MLYTVFGKSSPAIYDWGTEYERKACFSCNNIKNPIRVLGAYFRSWKKDFGLVHTAGGIVASEEACDFLYGKGISSLEKKKANVVFEKGVSNVNYFWIDPTRIIKYEESQHTRILSTCKECGYRTIKYDNLFMPRFKEDSLQHFSKLENTLFIIVDEYFISLMNNVLGKSFLDFNIWYTENTHKELK